MDRVKLKINEIVQTNNGQNLSISKLRKELIDEQVWTEEEISQICSLVSDEQLDRAKPRPKISLDFFNNIYFVYFLMIGFIVLIVISLQRIQSLKLLQQTVEIPEKEFIWWYFVIVGSILFLIRNGYRVIQYLKKNH